MIFRRVGLMGFVFFAMVFTSPGIGFSDSFVSASDITTLKTFKWGRDGAHSGASIKEPAGKRRARQFKGDSFLSLSNVELLENQKQVAGPGKGKPAFAGGKQTGGYHGGGDSFVSRDNMKMLENFGPVHLFSGRFKPDHG